MYLDIKKVDGLEDKNKKLRRLFLRNTHNFIPQPLGLYKIFDLLKT